MGREIGRRRVVRGFDGGVAAAGGVRVGRPALSGCGAGDAKLGAAADRSGAWGHAGEFGASRRVVDRAHCGIGRRSTRAILVHAGAGSRE